MQFLRHRTHALRNTPRVSLAEFCRTCYNCFAVKESPARKGVGMAMFVTQFILSVMANVVAYYICKRLDGSK